ncbi:MAG TPA: dihydrodipicolinate reductase C-terminal domain-containing protein, partial [Gemmatimonadaceae bacterium]|nr:dihydrodipicolinate reductase C-terminal domain-containing protein [Gemmatimonadaceae bacterium]
PVVVGTTGWYAHLPVVSAHVRERDGALLWAPNFSIGVNLFQELVARAAALMRGAASFDVHLVETHHAAKKDAPSGTAGSLARAASHGLGREVPITSVRTGHVPGTHELVFDAPFESIRLEHVARDRRVFAEGALAAARWLAGRRGVFTMRDLLAAPESTPNGTHS